MPATLAARKRFSGAEGRTQWGPRLHSTLQLMCRSTKTRCKATLVEFSAKEQPAKPWTLNLSTTCHINNTLIIVDAIFVYLVEYDMCGRIPRMTIRITCYVLCSV